MCPLPPATSTTSSNTTPSNDTDQSTLSSIPDSSSLSIPDRSKKRVYDYDSEAETEVWQLTAITTDWTLLINRMAANCRNISDEVYPGIHVGDRLTPF